MHGARIDYRLMTLAAASTGQNRDEGIAANM